MAKKLSIRVTGETGEAVTSGARTRPKKSPISPPGGAQRSAAKQSAIKPEMPSGKKAKITGMTSLNETPYFKIFYNGRSGYVPQTMFVSDKSEARSALKNQGVIITSEKDWRQITSEIELVRTFSKAPLIEEPGWTQSYFATRSGQIYGPKKCKKGRSVFKNDGINQKLGNHSDWLSEVAVHLSGQNLAIVAVLAGLAAPFLAISRQSLNLGFEFSGAPATGKTTCLELIASLSGNPEIIPNFHSTLLGFEQQFSFYNDLPYPVDEANLADSGNSALADFAFTMANGTIKRTAHQLDTKRYRFIFATTANRPFYESLTSTNRDIADAALQRLIPLRVPSDRSTGVFDWLPQSFKTSSELADHLRSAVRKNYGTAMDLLLKTLVEARHDDSPGLEQRISKDAKAFEEATGIADTVKGKSRVSAAFGLLYAAGIFAQTNGVIPKTWDCLAACLAGYRNYQSLLPERTSLETRLVSIASRPETLFIKTGKIPRLSQLKFEAHGAFLKRGIKKRLELLITDPVELRFFPDIGQLASLPEFRMMNLRDKDHRTKQRQVRRGKKKERFLCFVLPKSMATIVMANRRLHPR